MPHDHKRNWILDTELSRENPEIYVHSAVSLGLSPAIALSMPKPAIPKKMYGTRATASLEEATPTKKPGGGTAVGGGINFQAAVTAIAGAHLLRGTPLGWLPVADVPVAVWAESEGAGDDLRLELGSGILAEIQAKKGLNRCPTLWEALEALITAVRDGRLEYGALVVATDSSRTVREDLTKDLERLGQGRYDHLTSIGTELHRRLQSIGGTGDLACQRVGIRVVHALGPGDADIKAAKESLRWVCADEVQADAAWNALYGDALAQIAHRGRWTMAHLLRLLQREGIAVRDADFPAAIANKLAAWVRSTRDSFTLPGVRKRLPLSALLEMRVVGTVVDHPKAEDAVAALARYHDSASALDRNAPTYDAEWIGRFRRHAVVVAGPGLGKSTLMTVLANSYAGDGMPVLGVKLKPIAAAMERGDSFDHALCCQALDGLGITPDRFNRAGLNGLVVLADGLDDCGGSHDAVARALHAFASGHPSARIVVTTRPIGYTTAALVEWKHYRLLPPDKEYAAKHLAKLLSALKDSNGAAEDALEIAEREIAASRAAEAISSSPHLLGMAAALISSKGKLPHTRPRLYSELIALFENAGGGAVSRSISTPLAAHVLNGLGWLLMLDSLASADALTERCAELLAEPMGRRPLAMLELVEPALRYWEQLGIIERLHHDGTAYWTFVHKTFAEFTAARHLKALPDEQRAAHLDRLVDQPDWHEVIAFAGGLGLGDEIARLLVERRATGHSGQMERALALAGDRDAEVTVDLLRQLAALAFEAVKAEDGDRFSVGLALANLAKAHPTMIGPIAAEYLHDARSAVRLVAWACAVSAEPTNYGADELAEVLSALLPTVSTGISASLLGGICLGSDKDRDLVERIALAALAAQPDTYIKSFAEEIFGHVALGTMGFHRSAKALLRARGITEEVERPGARSSVSLALALLNPPDEWRRASGRALRALADAVVAEGGGAGDASPKPTRFPQFGALVSLTGFNKVPAYDVYEWEDPYDAAAVRAVLQAMVHASAIDPQALSVEAAAVVCRADTEEGFWSFDLDLPHVDVPEPDWRKAAALIPDRARLVAAMNHGSAWMAYVAGNIFAASSATREQSRSLLDDAEGTSLWAAMEVVREQQPTDVANVLILERLAGPLPDGAEYLFEGLKKGRIDRSPSACEAIRRGLASASPTIARAAANLANDLAERDQPLEPNMITVAYDDWLAREPEQKDGIIPPSPRETLLKLLISQNALDEYRLLATLSDNRSDVRNAGKEHMLGAIAASTSLKDAVIERIVSRSLPPAIAASVLQSETPLSDEQVRDLGALVREQDPKWRRVGVELLRRCYLSAGQIAEHGATLSADNEDEIRQVTKQRLAAVVATSPPVRVRLHE